MAEIKRLGRGLVSDMVAEGWGLWVDTSTERPFDVWITPTIGKNLKHLDPLSFVSQMNEFNQPDDKLSEADIQALARELPDQWVLDGIAMAISAVDKVVTAK